jgi:hypothetical protein
VRREFGDRGTEFPAAVLIASQQPMHLEGRCQPIGRGPGQAGPITQFGQPTWRFRDYVQDAYGFVEDADTAMLSHKEILASRIVRSQP